MWLRIAHRGAAGTRPELTIPAFERAIEFGVDMIELDVQLTRDRQLVVLHDLELGRTISGTGAVRDRDLSELQELDAGSWFDPSYGNARVASLREVLDLTRGRAALNVEIKSPAEDWAGTAEVLIDLLESSGDMATALVSSFSMGALRAVRDVSPEVRIAVLWYDANVFDSLIHAELLRAEAVHPHHKLAKQRFIDVSHEKGLRVNTWTVNDLDRMRALVAAGIDGIISDYPERFADLS